MRSTTKHYEGFTLYRLPEVRIVIAYIVSIKPIPELYICIYDKAYFWHIVHAFKLNIRDAHTLYLDMWNLVCCEIKCMIWDLVCLLNHVHRPFTGKWKSYVAVGSMCGGTTMQMLWSPEKGRFSMQVQAKLLLGLVSSCCGSRVIYLGVAARKTRMTRL
jgi:hypothetical protein